jgi:CRP-like cAMP-binding protein
LLPTVALPQLLAPNLIDSQHKTIPTKQLIKTSTAELQEISTFIYRHCHKPKIMASQQLIGFLKSTNLVSHKTAEEITATFLPQQISKHAFLFKEGRMCNEYFFLEKGFIRSFAHDTNGDEVTTNFYSVGQVVFEVSSFFNRTVSRENFQAITDCEGCFITYEQLNNLFHSLQEFREFGRAVLVSGFSSLKTRMLSMITETAEQRYDALLKTNPEIFQQAALKHIASYLGITDTSLSRIRKEYSKK